MKSAEEFDVVVVGGGSAGVAAAGVFGSDFLSS